MSTPEIPLQTLQPVADEKNLLASAGEANSCACGGCGCGNA